MGLTSVIAKNVAKTGEKLVIGFGKSKVKPNILVNGEFLGFKQGKKIFDFSKHNFEFQVKPDISIPFAPSTINQTKPTLRIYKNALTGKIDQAGQAELGNISVRLAESFEQVAGAAK